MGRKSIEGKWSWGKRWGDDEERTKAVEHRVAKEKEGLERLARQMKPLLGDAFKVEFDSHNYGSRIIVAMEGLNRPEATIKFRYSEYGFGDRGSVEGISVKCEGVYGWHWAEIKALGRSYAYDFKAGQMKPASLKKMCEAISEHLGSILACEQLRAAQKADGSTMGARAKELLEAEGYKVKVAIGSTSADVTVARPLKHGEKKIISLKATGSGFSSYAKGYYGLTIKATPDNLVAVIKGVEALLDIMEGGE